MYSIMVPQTTQNMRAVHVFERIEVDEERGIIEQVEMTSQGFHMD